jgi:hypothetical protein
MNRLHWFPGGKSFVGSFKTVDLGPVNTFTPAQINQTRSGMARGIKIVRV